MKEIRKGKVVLKWLNDEQVWEIYSPIAVMSGHTPIIDWPMGYDKKELRNLAWCLNKLADLPITKPKPLKHL